MTWELDGETETAVSFNNTLIKAFDAQTQRYAKRLDIRGQLSNGNSIIVSISDFRDGAEGNCMTEESYYLNSEDGSYCEDLGGGVMICNGFLGSYSSMPNVWEISSFGDDDGSATITSCNETNKSVSGVFDFTITDFFSGELLYEVTNGVFTDVTYTVVE